MTDNRIRARFLVTFAFVLTVPMYAVTYVLAQIAIAGAP